ncbi:tetratricopeptide repeat protein [Rhodobacter sp. NTK016B]|uniref:tetratricopeptide repeat protein n=1 Tax=Rhodobacter sp. NTK016B TaxID=2759676 RepID=UPI001A8F5B9A|nr:tetratricopeptide repeat protein [Rhodobacter sp. NTK016B]MBN8293703.1 tetratricopeptide repeat protein [Rhodobacter sp. NTK016B]
MMTDRPFPMQLPDATLPPALRRQEIFATLSALESRKDFTTALAFAEDALDAFPNDPKLIMRRAGILRQLGQLDESVAQLQQLVKARPDDLSAKHELSVALRFAGAHEQSLAQSDEILQANPTHRAALFARIYTHLHAQDFPAAIKAARDLRVRLPDDGEGLLRHARALRLAGQPEAARDEIDGALIGGRRLEMTADTDRRLRLELARALLDAQDIRRSDKVLADLLRDFPDERDVVMQGLAQARAALNHNAAFDLCERGLRQWPSETRFAREKVAALLAMGNLVTAQEALDTLALPDADLRIRLLIELRRFDEARERVRALPDKQALERDRFEAKILQAEERTEAAFALLDRRYKKRQTPELAPLLMGLLSNLQRPDEAQSFAECLPASVSQTPAMIFARADILRLKGDVDAWSAMIVRAAKDGMRVLPVVRRLVSTAVQWGIGTPHFHRIIARLDGLLADLAPRLPDTTLTLLRLNRAFGLGDWDTVLALSGQACITAPRDLTLAAMRARALAETGDLDGAVAVCDQILAQAPTMSAVIELRLALHLAQRDAPAGAAFLSAKLMRDELALTLRLAQHLQFTGQTDILRSVVARQIARAGDDTPRWLRSLSDVFEGTDTAGPPGFQTYPVYEPLSPEDAAALMDPASGNLAGSDLFLAEAATLWRLQNKPEALRHSWMRQALRATHASRTVATRSTAPESLVPYRTSDAFSTLKERLDNREPCLLASTHFGPHNRLTVAPELSNLTYLMQDGPRHPELEKQYSLIRAVESNPAAQIIKALRARQSLIATPDFPAEMRWKAEFRSDATALLFGLPCQLIDTIPKLAHAMHYPVFWIQQAFRNNEIVVEVRRMSDPEPDEPLAAYQERWAQEYLDLLAEIMTSDPRNQNLYAPLTRFLAARGGAAN